MPPVLTVAVLGMTISFGALGHGRLTAFTSAGVGDVLTVHPALSVDCDHHNAVAVAAPFWHTVSMTSPVVTATALEIIHDLPSGTELSASDLQRETAWRLYRSAPVGHTMPFRVLARQLARSGRLQVVCEGPTLYRVP